jgi:hypothetical protein
MARIEETATVKQRMSILTIILAGLLAACNGTVDSNVATLNALATLSAGGSVNGGDPGAPSETPVPPTETPLPNLIDLTLNPNSLLVSAWGSTYGLPSGSAFTIKATQGQAGQYVIQVLQTEGFSDTVKGGSAAIGVGQIRIDLALVDLDGKFGSGSVTFQPTLDNGQLRLNPRGGEFAGLNLPGNLTAAVGDAVHTALTGARSNQLSQVNLDQLSLDNTTVEISGRRR